MYSKRKKQNCGQLAIFIALIFQLVFILFAMSLNVALVVHDKINLQNSVDLAAYYGAMKQAQTLNAIAHINYQIRQSWKLLAWRTRVLGNPYAAKKTPNNGQEASLEFKPNTHSHFLKKVYIFCTAAYNADSSPKVGWSAFRIPERSGDIKWTPDSGQDATFCENINLTINPLSIPNASNPFLQPVVTAIVRTATAGNIEIEKKCKAYSYTNWLFALFSFYHFRVDQSKKAKLIYKIAEQVAGAGKEIDSQQLIYEGARKTFMNNLTYINERSFRPDNFETHDSLEKSYGPNQWLSPESFYVYPPLYVQTSPRSTEPTDGCRGEGQFINTIPNDVTHSYLIQLAQQDLISYSNNTNLCKETGSNNLCESSAGLSKKDDFIVYFGAKAELEYKNQIFLPFFTNHKLKLKAQAFAKPFGGRIGPKFEDDSNLPRTSGIPSPISIQTASNRSPNYAKYPGDTLGLTSHYVQEQWAKKIYNADSSHKSIENYVYSADQPPAPLAKNSVPQQWELAAVAPDLFDVTYFTILPSYMETYYDDLQAWPGFNPPRDFGGGIRQQVEVGGVWPVPALNPSMDKPFYVIKDLSQLLTGWNPPIEKYKDPDIYPADIYPETQFAKCDKWDYELDNDGDARMATGCVFGGRTGYSVKMINKEHLRDDVIRGGTPPPPGSGWNW